jgi:2-polyprenyl-3-methyl-5-hydroxy-6-metoxy-1,4-benzoquinol methylase
MPSISHIVRELVHAIKNKPDLRDVYVAARDMGIIKLNVKHFGYQLARQLEGKLQGIDCSLEPRNHSLVSKPTTQADMESPWFAYWCKQLKIAPIYHRKIWEYAFVLQCLHEHGLLHEGINCMGFGCGEEPMASYFASRGMDVLITDLDSEEALRQGWVETSQHAKSREAAFRADLISREHFDAKVRHQVVDMNAVPDVPAPYDFCWSICAMEHLGNIQQGLDFVVNSLKVVKPGGLAIHTTEFNYLSDKETRETGAVVLFLRRHFEELARRLHASGHEMLGPDFSVGDGALDTFIDMPPYGNEKDSWPLGHLQTNFPAHLKLSIAGYAATCFGLVVRKRRD